MVGDSVVINGVEYEVVWSGGEGLTGERFVHKPDYWEPPPRLYNKTGKHSKKKVEDGSVRDINYD